MRQFPHQSRRMSAVEAVVSTAIGYIVAVATQLVVFPAFGLAVGIWENLGIGLAFTVVSVIRSYLVRRLFERLHRG
jgi:uncharacterized membrane protein